MLGNKKSGEDEKGEPVEKVEREESAMKTKRTLKIGYAETEYARKKFTDRQTYREKEREII